MRQYGTPDDIPKSSVLGSTFEDGTSSSYYKLDFVKGLSMMIIKMMKRLSEEQGDHYSDSYEKLRDRTIFFYMLNVFH